MNGLTKSQNVSLDPKDYLNALREAPQGKKNNFLNSSPPGTSRSSLVATASEIDNEYWLGCASDLGRGRRKGGRVASVELETKGTLPGPRVKPELLAPAGDRACLVAAVENGADAVYFGLQRHNARARATNFDGADLPAVMALLHRRGVKGYVTLNTLV